MLSQSSQHDVYHLPKYHALAQERGEGQALLFVHREGAHHVAVPLLVRPVPDMLGLPGGDLGWSDAVSVYGYPGPLWSRNVPASVVARYQQGLERSLRQRRVVTVFSRLHPLFAQRPFLCGPAGTYVPFGQTVSIDLMLSEEEQYGQYRSNHRRGVARLGREGVRCERDPEAMHLDAFVDLYHQTMRRVGAASFYFFSRDYFLSLLTDLPAHLFVCFAGGRVVSGGVFTLHNGIVQYHLGGTDDAFLRAAPMKLVFDTVRRWASACGASVFHLGGGVGGRQDSLFHFKAGFSDRRHPVATWQWVLDPVAERMLRERRAQYERSQGRDFDPSVMYFPAYRAPPVETSRTPSA